MPTNIYTAGLQNVGSYQVSGIPFVTGSSDSSLDANKVVKVEFPYVTKSITVINTSATTGDIRVHFQSGSGTTIDSNDPMKPVAISTNADVLVGNHFISLGDGKSSITMDVKVKEVYISTANANRTFQLFAELTNIPTGRMYHLTGSGITAGANGG